MFSHAAYMYLYLGMWSTLLRSWLIFFYRIHFPVDLSLFFLFEREKPFDVCVYALKLNIFLQGDSLRLFLSSLLHSKTPPAAPCHVSLSCHCLLPQPAPSGAKYMFNVDSCRQWLTAQRANTWVTSTPHTHPKPYVTHYVIKKTCLQYLSPVHHWWGPPMRQLILTHPQHIIVNVKNIIILTTLWQCYMLFIYKTLSLRLKLKIHFFLWMAITL